MAAFIIHNTSIANAVKSSQQDLFYKIDVSIDITSWKIPVKEFTFSKAVRRRPAVLLK